MAPHPVHLIRPTNDTIKTNHTSGSSDGLVIPIVVDPKKLTGNTYNISFSEDADTNSATYGQTVWNLKNDAGTVLLTNQKQILPGNITSDAPFLTEYK